MARKEKLTLDYYPHYAVQGDITAVIQELYGNDGYAVLHKIYEQFCLRDRQYINLSEYSTLATIAAYCKVNQDRFFEIVNELVKLGAFDKDLWLEKRILISSKFIENTKDAYKKRATDIVDFEELKNNFLHKTTSKGISSAGNSENYEKTVQSGDINQQIKLKEIKGNETKPNQTKNDGGAGEDFSFPSKPIHPDLMFDSNIQKVFDIYKTECKNLIPLGFEPKNIKIRQRVWEFLNLISGDFEYLKELFKKANTLKVIVKRKIDFQMLLNNHERIFSGYYLQADENVDFLEDVYKEMGVNSE